MVTSRITSSVIINAMKQKYFITYCRRRYLHYISTLFVSRAKYFDYHSKDSTLASKPTRRCHNESSYTSYQPSSALFVAGFTAEFASFLEVDLDLENRLENIDLLSKNIKARGMENKIDLKQLVDDHEKLKEIKLKKSQLEQDKIIIQKKKASFRSKVQEQSEYGIDNAVKEEMAELNKEYEDIKTALKLVVEERWEIEDKVMLTALKLPNNLHNDTPDAEEVLEEFGSPSSVTKSESHVQIGQKNNLIKFSNIGMKAYYLKGDLAVLEQKLLDNVSTRLRRKRFIPTSIPEFVRTLIVEGCGVDFTDPDQIYFLEQRVEGKHEENLPMTGYYVSGVSLMSFAALIGKRNFKRSSLPLHYYALGRSYIPDSAQEDLPGLFGALQTMKIDICGVCSNLDEAMSVYNSYGQELINLYKLFNCPFRLVRLSAGALKPSEQLRTEVQLWAPSVQRYIKVASISVIGDYLSQRLMCRHSDKHGEIDDSTSLLHIVHGEVLDVTRLIAILMEYCSVDIETGKYRLPELDFLKEHTDIYQHS